MPERSDRRRRARWSGTDRNGDVHDELLTVGSVEASSLRRATEPLTAVQPKRGDSSKRDVLDPTGQLRSNGRRYPADIPARHHGADHGPPLRIAVLAPIAWRTPPRHYGPWELFASLLTEGLVAAGHDVTLVRHGRLDHHRRHCTAPPPVAGRRTPPSSPRSPSASTSPSVFERADEFDIIHNGFDFLPLTYSGLVDTPVVTTIHGFSSPRIVPVYERYDATTHYVAISDADRHPRAALRRHDPPRHRHRRVRRAPHARRPPAVLRPHPSRQGHGARPSRSRRRAGRRLVIAGIIQDERVLPTSQVAPHVDGDAGPLPRTGRAPPTEPACSGRPTPCST